MTNISFKSFTRKSKITTFKLENAEQAVIMEPSGLYKFIQDDVTTAQEVEALAVLLGGFNPARVATTDGFSKASKMTVEQHDALLVRFDALIQDTIDAMEGK